MSNILDIDPSLFERNLLFKELQDQNDLVGDSLFNIKPKESDDIPWKPVKPNPGYCVKLKTLEGDKVFVNICHTDGIPEPVEITEEKLLEMIMDDDVPSFRIPISIGDLHIESDKARNPCSVYDIAVNSKFYKKMDTSEVFNTFFLNVSIQSLQEKYSLNLDLKSEKPFLLLKNRKAVGTLQIHRIQQREVKKAPGQLIQEIDSKQTPTKKLIEVISDNHESSSGSIQPQGKSNNRINQSSDNKTHCDRSNFSLKKTSNQVISKENFLNDRRLKKPSTPDEKGVQESRITKSDKSVEELHKSEIISDNIEKSIENNWSERKIDKLEMCSSLFCLKQYPENGFPEHLFASIHLNVKSSKDFDLLLDDNRINVTLTGTKKPWFDVYLPYNIETNNVEACFINENQKLLIKMDIKKS